MIINATSVTVTVSVSVTVARRPGPVAATVTSTLRARCDPESALGSNAAAPSDGAGHCW